MVAFENKACYTICMKENLIHARTCVYNINYHVVWSVKYRRKVITEEMEQTMKQRAVVLAEKKGFNFLYCKDAERYYWKIRILEISGTS